MSPALNDQYHLGLSFLKKAIELELGQAGAILMSNSVYFRMQRNGCGVLTNTTIAAVPADAPKILVKFIRQEVLDCADGVNHADVLQKISQYSSAYAKFRSSPERSNRQVSNRRRASGQHRVGMN